MLEGASNFLRAGKADFVFISTHSQEMHRNCKEKLESFGYIILADADMKETFSYDGLIIAKHHVIENPQSLEISRKIAKQIGAVNADKPRG